MGRASDLIAAQKVEDAKDVDGEVVELNSRPMDIPEDVWQLIQENGKLATERLNEILASPRFHRIKAGDQAKLIQLAQNRAYGMPKTNKEESNRRRGGARDVTASSLRDLASRATLPEYKASQIVDATPAKERAKK